MEHWAWLKDGLVFLLAAGVVVPIFHHFRLGTVLGFIVAGVVVGPFGLGRFQFEAPFVEYFLIEDPARIEPFAELGVIFLLFVLGLEMSFAKLWDLRRFVLGTGSAQVALSALGIGLAVWLLDAGAGAALVIGLTLALSSTAIVMQMLVEQRRLATPTGRISLSVLLMQDLMAIPLLVTVGILGGDGEGILPALALALIKAIAAVVVILLIGRFVLAPLLRRAAITGIRELILAIVLVAVIAASVATGAAGLSPELGAFLAGVLLAESEYRQQIETDIDPFRGLLLGLFFTSVGMTIDPVFAVSQIGWIVIAVGVLMVFKAAVAFAACRLFGVGHSSAAETAILLAQAGEFGFVVLALAASDGVIPASQAQFVIVVISLSMMVTPFLAPLARVVASRLEWVESAGAGPDGTADMADHVVIGGFGRVGQMVARVLESENVPFVAFDRNARLVGEQRRLGRRVFFGDAARQEMLERVGANRARAFVVTVDSARHAARMVRSARICQPGAPVYARARDAANAVELTRVGASSVVPEVVEGSLQLAADVLVGLEFPEDVVLRRVGFERERERGALADVAGSDAPAAI